ncbi:MAG: AAA family ATPase [Deltaproteobacteria bacterium]|jgi:predicted ATPase|nr:AAA family ATPase [Deltaproteobacteria bacterium]
MRIEYLEIHNFKSLQNVVLKNIPGMAVFIGRNGVGKSALFDVFSFLQDSLFNDVSVALKSRGGFREVVSRGQNGDISFILKFRPEKGAPLISYELSIGLNDKQIPVVKTEIMRIRPGSKGKPWPALEFHDGKGWAAEGDLTDCQSAKEGKNRLLRALNSPRILAVKALGNMADFGVASKFCQRIEDWLVADFHINDAREITNVQLAKRLAKASHNLASVTHYTRHNQARHGPKIIEVMKQYVPGIIDIQTIFTEDGRIALKFIDNNFQEHFLSSYVSDGVIKIFTYLLLLYNPERRSWLGLIEPENQIYPKLLSLLVEEFRQYSVGEGQEKAGQVFISTHSPDLLDAVNLEELYFLVKDLDGYASVMRAADNKQIKEFVEGGDLLGYLWNHSLLIEGV